MKIESSRQTFIERTNGRRLAFIGLLDGAKKLLVVVEGGWVETKNIVWLRSISELPDLDLTWTIA